MTEILQKVWGQEKNRDLERALWICFDFLPLNVDVILFTQTCFFFNRFNVIQKYLNINKLTHLRWRFSILSFIWYFLGGSISWFIGGKFTDNNSCASVYNTGQNIFLFSVYLFVYLLHLLLYLIFFVCLVLSFFFFLFFFLSILQVVPEQPS